MIRLYDYHTVCRQFGNIVGEDIKRSDERLGAIPVKLAFNGIDPSFFDDNGKAYVVPMMHPKRTYTKVTVSSKYGSMMRKMLLFREPIR